MWCSTEKEGEDVRSSDVLLIRWFRSDIHPIVVEEPFCYFSMNQLFLLTFLHFSFSKKIFDFNQFRWERNNLMKKEKDLGLPVISSRPLPFFGKAITLRMVDVPQHMVINLSKKSFTRKSNQIKIVNLRKINIFKNKKKKRRKPIKANCKTTVWRATKLIKWSNSFSYSIWRISKIFFLHFWTVVSNWSTPHFHSIDCNIISLSSQLFKLLIYIWFQLD